MNTKNLFAYVLSALVLIITIMALLGVWDVIDWGYLRQYLGKTIQSLIIIVISAVAIYLIQSLLFKKESANHEDEKSRYR